MPMIDDSTENLLVIFGAGASFDSARDIAISQVMFKGVTLYQPQSRPPLANELFHIFYSPYLDRYPQLAAAVPRLRQAVAKGTNIEAELRRLDEEAKTLPHVASQVMAIRFYLRDVIADMASSWLAGETHNVTNYAQLVNEVETWRLGNPKKRAEITYVTFNYDVLLERALEGTLSGHGFDRPGDYIKRPHARVIKPHGSVDWFHEVANLSVGTSDANSLIAHASELKLVPGFLGRADTQGGPGKVPAIAIPVEQKKTFECPDDHLVCLQNVLREADKILVIGWRGTEAHFMDLMKQEISARTKRRGVWIVAADEGEARKTWDSMQALGLKLRPGDSEVTPLIHPGFSAFLANDGLARVLDHKLKPYRMTNAA